VQVSNLKRSCCGKMILFKPYHAKLILEGKKTQTRRLWRKPRVKVGNIYKAKTNLYSKQHFALLKITGLRKEKLGEISPEDVKKEGYATLGDFIQAWKQIHGFWGPELEVYVIDFEVIEPFHKLLKDFPQGKWLDAADGCDDCDCCPIGKKISQIESDLRILLRGETEKHE